MIIPKKGITAGRVRKDIGGIAFDSLEKANEFAQGKYRVYGLRDCDAGFFYCRCRRRS